MTYLRKKYESQETKKVQEPQEPPQAQTKQIRQTQDFAPSRSTQEIRKLSRDEEVAEIKLKNAFKLMKQERYGAARHILRELPPDNLKAQQMLEYMEGKVEKRKSPAAISKWGVFIVLLIVIAVGGAIGVSLFVQNFLSQYTLDEIFTQALGGGDMVAYNAVATYCTISTDMQENKCLQWPIEVITDYPEAADECFGSYGNTIRLDDSEVRSIRSCLNGYGVPAPY